MGCRRLTNVGIRHFAEHCLEIKKLHIGERGNVTDDTLFIIAAMCRHLESLYILTTSYVDEGMLRLLDNCPRLCDFSTMGWNDCLSPMVKTHVETVCTTRATRMDVDIIGRWQSGSVHPSF